MKILIWLKIHKTAAIVAAAIIAVVALTLGLSLGLTLPVKSVTATGEVALLTGESYTKGISLSVTSRSGKTRTVPVTADMISGFDPTVAGLQEVTITYKKHTVAWSIRALGNEDVTLRVREGSMPQEYEPNDPFPTSGVFELYYNDTLFRTRPIRRADAPGFTTRLSREYDITLCYREGLSLPYHYNVPVIIESIEAEGILLLPQGSALAKADIIGDVRFLVKYKDGTEEYVTVTDDLVAIQEGALSVDPSGKDYESQVLFFYKGYEVSSSVTAYYGELLAPKSVTLQPDKTVYLQGEGFDYSAARLEVVFERFGGAPVTVRVTQEMVLLAELQGDPGSENRHYVPISDGSTPIIFEEEGYVTLLAYYNSAESAPLRVRVVSAEDAGRITGMETTWNGRQSGPPQKGEDLDVTNATLTVEYGFGYRYETVPMDSPSVVITGYNKDVAGDQLLTVTYTVYGEDPEEIVNKYEIERTIRVFDATSDVITGIVGVMGWDDYMYYTLDELIVPDTAYLEVEIGYGGQENGKVFIKGNDDVTITGFTPHKLGTQELTFTYAEKEIKHIITVLDDREKTIIDFWAPHDIRIGIGDPLDTSGDCTVFYSTGEKLTLSLAEVLDAGGTMTGSYDASAVGDYPVRFYYPDFDSSDHFTWIHVQGAAPLTAKGIRLDLSEAKSTYKVGDAIDIEHIKLYLVYSDNETEEDITSQLKVSLFENFDTSTTGARTATVRYVSEKGSFATGFDYTVVGG